MTKKAWIIVAILCVALIGGLVWLSRSNQIDVSNIDINAVQGATAMNGQIADHTTGNMNSKVILIEYGDFQCPGCAAAAPVVQKIMEKYGDKMGLVFRNYPLYNAHPNAFAAASAAEAAGLHGKYWEMHDYLYTNRDSWVDLDGQSRTDYFVGAAKSVGVNDSAFATLMTDARIKKKIDFDVALGKKANLSGTPSFFIDGVDVGDHDVKDGTTLIPTDNDNSTPAVWSDADLFGKLVIEPALKSHGISF